ncbi:MAG: GTP-binding protein [Roseibium sp.]|uniref:CobW family GTP-binding protein n=1 Tax=Roseibium sp. TaxID=1936156 RepID=UPI003D9C4512
MTRDERIPVIVVGGFLGAGKTTLVNGLIRQAGGLRIAALVNDFGAMNLDADLVVSVKGSTVALANGCVCCTIRDDLANACAELLTREPQPEAVIVELSGVSAPGPVLATFLETDLRSVFSLSSVLVVVDALTFDDLDGVAGNLTRDQLRSADLVVLSKTDLTSQASTASIRSSIGKWAPGAPILDAPRGALPLATVLEPVNSQGKAPKDTSQSGHGLSAHTWTSARPLSLPMLEQTIAALPSDVYRCKGYVWLEEFPKLRFLLQAVGWRYNLSAIGSWTGTQPVSKLTTIRAADCLSDTELNNRLDACIGTQDRSASPILRLVHKLAPELLEESSA